jgi:hypothetical protein
LRRRSQFKDVGKGWYSLAESRQDTYDFSKLKRLMASFYAVSVPRIDCNGLGGFGSQDLTAAQAGLQHFRVYNQTCAQPPHKPNDM